MQWECVCGATCEARKAVDLAHGQTKRHTPLVAYELPYYSASDLFRLLKSTPHSSPSTILIAENVLVNQNRNQLYTVIDEVLWPLNLNVSVLRIYRHVHVAGAAKNEKKRGSRG